MTRGRCGAWEGQAAGDRLRAERLSVQRAGAQGGLAGGPAWGPVESMGPKEPGRNSQLTWKCLSCRTRLLQRSAHIRDPHPHLPSPGGAALTMRCHSVAMELGLGQREGQPGHCHVEGVGTALRLDHSVSPNPPREADRTREELPPARKAKGKHICFRDTSVCFRRPGDCFALESCAWKIPPASSRHGTIEAAPPQVPVPEMLPLELHSYGSRLCSLSKYNFTEACLRHRLIFINATNIYRLLGSSQYLEAGNRD